MTPGWARKPADTAGNVPFPYAFSTNDSLQFLVSRAGSFSGTRTLSENCHPFFPDEVRGGYILCSPLRLFCQRCLGPPLLQWQAHTSLEVIVTDIPTVCPSLPPLPSAAPSLRQWSGLGLGTGIIREAAVLNKSVCYCWCQPLHLVLMPHSIIHAALQQELLGGL